jgi:dTMP kinase
VGGIFIAFEGPEGGGKTTQITRLAERLRPWGQSVLVTREPGGTPLGERIRHILLEPGGVAICARAEALLHNAARAQHVEAVIRPALDRGQIVIADRFLDSTLAYQGGGRGLDLGDLRAIQSVAVDGCLPDVKVLLDLPVEIGLERRRRDVATVNRIDDEAVAFHERVRRAFLALAAEEPERWLVVDAARDADAVASEILAGVIRVLEARLVGAV